jgi:hypothetical protein
MDGRDRWKRDAATGGPEPDEVAAACWRLGVGIAQTSLAIAAAAALLRHDDPVVVLLLAVAATATTGHSLWRWGGFWTRRRPIDPGSPRRGGSE